jgi:hypothetical protein
MRLHEGEEGKNGTVREHAVPSHFGAEKNTLSWYLSGKTIPSREKSR